MKGKVHYLILYVIRRTKWHILTFMCDCLKTQPLCHSESILFVFMERHRKMGRERKSRFSINGAPGLCSCAHKSLFWQGDKCHESLFMKLTRPLLQWSLCSFPTQKDLFIVSKWSILYFSLHHYIWPLSDSQPVSLHFASAQFLAELLETNCCFPHERSRLWKNKSKLLKWCWASETEEGIKWQRFRIS